MSMNREKNHREEKGVPFSLSAKGETMKKYLKKEYLLIAFIFIAILSTILIKPLGDLDEIWNYNVARNIAKGQIPYKDISTITTPLLPAINAIFLKMLGDELIVMRILAAVLGTAIIYMVFKILRKLTNETNISMIATLLIGILFRELYCIDYNYLTLFIALLILYLELKQHLEQKQYLEQKQHLEQKQYLEPNEPLNFKQHLLLGILGGLAICTKQSIGLLVAFVTVICPILEVRTKQELKTVMHKILVRILGVAIPCFILLIYLLATNSLKDFINYAIQGISTFDNYIPYDFLFISNAKEVTILARVMPIAVGVMILITLVTIIMQIKNKTRNQIVQNIQILTLYSLPILIVIYPISDKIHFLIGITIALIGVVYLITVCVKWLYKKIPQYTYTLFAYKSITLIIWLIIAGWIANQGYQNIKLYTDMYARGTINKDIEHYKYIEIPDYLRERIEQIGNYIKEKESQNIQVYILDAEAAVYNIPQERYIKNYDMFLKGNIGKDGEQGIIEKIKNETTSNTVYLIKKEEFGLNWQTPTQVIDYIRENLEKTGEISIYDEYTCK